MHLKVFAPFLTGSALFCFLVVSLAAGIGPQPELSLSLLQAHQVPQHPIQVRTPPTFNEASSKTWDPLPPNWFLGNWFITHSNQELYHIFRNFIWTLTRPCADDACYSLEATHLADLASFQLVNDTEKPNATYFGYSLDTVIAAGGGGAYQSVPTASLAAQNNTYEVISWGYDSHGAGFVVLYETPAASETVASLDICSRTPSGPTNDTLDAIKSGIQKLGNKKLIGLLKNVTKTPQDGGRDNEPWPSCNATCRTNGNKILFFHRLSHNSQPALAGIDPCGHVSFADMLTSIFRAALNNRMKPRRGRPGAWEHGIENSGMLA
ncbi:uncharacterized protein Z520_08172 [Fonsecaea multimorphosa CBS 102226]|uniref:Lipocalin-like domain-containing protein n=1 Tax=Fonsecaea multimorphosa CBS 102226 TaxID=1442371 RepID=A0A0D2JRB6_9EURO|nr:uncharacterized protein Z520_08172 [Fonsecaea multimorphosa CBS 102226]KIX95917.1 hypothetical protein Z520_08172 [Fonsecaea multimorphosa CBS 102226]